MLPQLFARRYLVSAASRSVVNLIAGLSVVAVAMPVAAMLILLSVFNGFEQLVRSKWSVFDAELTLTPREGSTFEAAEVDTAALRRLPQVAACSFVLEQRALLQHDGRQAITTVRGVDDAYGEVLDWRETVTTGDPSVRLGDLERMVIGQSMALQLGIRTLADAEVETYAVRRGAMPSLLPAANYTLRTVPVGGIFVLDLESEQQQVLVSLRLARDLFHYPGRASALLLRLAPGTDPDRARAAVAEVTGDRFDLRTRSELRASFYRIMRYEKWGIFFVALLVLVIASFSVVGALAMLVVETRPDIATLQALGADTRLVRAVFRAEGLLICGLGAAVGVVLGVTLTLIQQHFGLLQIPAETFLTTSYPVEFRFGDLAAVLAAFAAVALLLTDTTVRSMIQPPKNAHA